MADIDSSYNGLILGSGSPQRVDMMNLLDVQYEIVTPDIDEKRFYELDPFIRAQKLAEEKAKEIAKKYSKAVIVSGDSYGLLQDTIFEKAESKQQAKEMLLELSGKTYSVISGYCVYNPHEESFNSGVESADITMRKLTEYEVDQYLTHDEWMGKAPPMTIRKKGISLVEKLEGSYYTIIGLPLAKVTQELTRAGIQIL